MHARSKISIAAQYTSDARVSGLKWIVIIFGPILGAGVATQSMIDSPYNYS